MNSQQTDNRWKTLICTSCIKNHVLFKFVCLTHFYQTTWDQPELKTTYFWFTCYLSLGLAVYLRILYVSKSTTLIRKRLWNWEHIVEGCAMVCGKNKLIFQSTCLSRVLLSLGLHNSNHTDTNNRITPQKSWRLCYGLLKFKK